MVGDALKISSGDASKVNCVQKYQPCMMFIGAEETFSSRKTQVLHV